MINLAGHPVSIFLYRFVLRKNAISYVLNESIAEDMYPDIDEKVQPLVHACSETLLRYRQFCRGDTIMDGNILTDGYFELMLGKGLGAHFNDKEKQNLFNDVGGLGKIVLIGAGLDRTLLEAELFVEERTNQEARKKVFDRVVEIVSSRMNNLGTSR